MGHIAVKSFNGEVVDEYGNSIPLHETYLHHWIYYGLGSETRKTDTWIPDPYGIVVGNPDEVPSGCNLYNVTVDEDGDKIQANYIGGLNCCYDETQCKLREGFESVTRKLFLKYTVEWVEWEPRIVPVKVYILDITDTGTGSDSCNVEYEVKECNSEERKNGDCIDTQITRLVMPHGGDIIYGVAHQHSGGAGSALYGQDGRLLCTSIPSYGNGKEAGNEENYIVGMSTCYPKPGSVKIADGETLTLISNYSSNQMHTGVMGLFYVLVAEEDRPLLGPPKNMICFNSLLAWCIEMSVKTGAVFIAGNNGLLFLKHRVKSLRISVPVQFVHDSSWAHLPVITMEKGKYHANQG
ncbi:stress up-regulated Nod 19 protein [Rhynchospora pubera]|uniref:Stress up-regulated Nod 19 protein n=1 Tax=Rhynchospora pubera TaxID=906938 RepID=A0AAV8GSJ9_9POAL|nr:stress up-regulated Nod 19 protein [Rhynchospora pubera]